MRTRPLPLGHLRAFEAVARHLNFRAAADELALTQSAVSRQIQGIEADVGLPLFRRHTRAVELTAAGAQLLQACAPAMERIDASVRQIRQSSGRRSVSVTTFASFASMWLIPRLEAFQRAHPDIDLRIDASDHTVDLATADVDLALRYGPSQRMPAAAVRLFGEQLTPVLSPWLQQAMPINTMSDLAQHTLIEAIDIPHQERLSWRGWFGRRGATDVQPKRWITFNYALQITQAALAGQGVALARTPMVAEQLACGDLIEPLPRCRAETGLSYWLLAARAAEERAEVQAFRSWLLAQAAQTRLDIGDEPDPETLAHAD